MAFMDETQREDRIPPNPSPVTRRGFVSGVAAGLAGATLASGCTRDTVGSLRSLTPEEAALLETIAARIIPTDRDPGAREANVVRYIDWQLAGFFARWRDAYARGLAGVEESSRAMFGQAFADLTEERQQAVLVALEAGQAPGEAWERGESSSVFFARLRDHCMQGFYGSPRHGGNAGYVSYRMLGLDYPRYQGQNRYDS